MRFRLLALPLLLAPLAPARAAAPILGRWLTEDGSAVIAVAPCGPALCGHVERVVRTMPGATRNDSHNPDPSLRARPILGVPILTGFTDAGADWRGRIYNPQDGKTYKSIVTREGDGTLKVKGCIAFFCRAQVWRPAR